MTADGAMVLPRMHPLAVPLRLALLVAWSTSPATAAEDAYAQKDCRCWASQGACTTNAKFMVPNCAGSCERQLACDALFEAGSSSVLEEKDKKIAQLEEQLKSSVATQQVQEKDERIAQLEDALTKSADGKELLKEKDLHIAELSERIAELKTGAAGMEQRLQEKDTKISQLEEQLKSSVSKQEKDERIGQLEEEKDTKIAQLEEQLKSNVAKLEEQLATSDAALRQLEEKNATIVQLQAKLETGAAGVEQQLQERDTKIAELQEKLKQENSAAAEASDDKEEKDTKIAQLEEQLKSSAATSDAARRQLEEHNATIVQLQAKLETGAATVEQQLQERETKIAELQEHLKQEEKDTKIAQLEEQLNSSVATSDAALRQLEEKNATIVQLQAKLETGAAGVEQQLQERDTKIAELQEQLKQERSVAAEASDDKAECQASLSSILATNKECQANLSDTHASAKEQREATIKELEVSLDEATKQAAEANARLSQLEATGAQAAEKLKLSEAVARECEQQLQQDLSKLTADAASADARAAELEASMLQREQDAAASARKETEGDLKRARAAVEDLQNKQSAQFREMQICASKTQQLEQEAERERSLRETIEVELSEHRQLVETLRVGEVGALRSTSTNAVNDPPLPLGEEEAAPDAAAAAEAEAAATAAASEGQKCIGASCQSNYTEQVRQTTAKVIQDFRQKIALNGRAAEERAIAAWVEAQRLASEAFARVCAKLEPYTRRCSARLVILKDRILSRLQRFSPHLDRVLLHLEAVTVAAFAAGYPGSIALLLLATGLALYTMWRVLLRLFLVAMAIARWTFGCIGCCFRRSCACMCCCCCRTYRRCKRPLQAEGDGKSRKPSATEHFFIGQQDEDAMAIAEPEPLHEPPPSAGNSMRAMAPPTGSSCLGAANVLRPPPAGILTSPGIGAPRVKAVAAAWPPPPGGITETNPPPPPQTGSPRQPSSTATDGTPREFRALDMHLEDTVLNRVDGRLERIEGKLGMLMELCSKVPQPTILSSVAASADAAVPVAGDMY